MGKKQGKNYLKKPVEDKSSFKTADAFFMEDIHIGGYFLDFSLKGVILTSIIIGCVFIVNLLLFYFGILEKVKPLILSYYDTINYLRYTRGSNDIFVVLSGLIIVMGFSIIQPILGVCAISIVRCWLDGYTYPTDNTYFVWAIIFISISYIFRSWFKKDSLKIDIHTLIFFLFTLVLYLLLPLSHQYGKSYRYTILWTSYAFLFFSTYGSLKTAKQRNVLLWTLIIAMGLQTWYAFMHFQYVLPFLRKSIAEDPALRIKFFGTAELSRELIYRFNVNRAFGTMLFPNALGGFIILLFPISIFWAYQHIKMFVNLWDEKNTNMSKRRERWVLVQTAIIWLISTIIIYATELFPLTYSLESSSNIDIYLAGGLAGLISLIPSCVFAWICIKKGYQTGKYFLYSLILMLSVIFAFLSLWLTYSRGSWLSLGLSFLTICFLLTLSRISDKKSLKGTLSIIIFTFIIVPLFVLSLSLNISNAEDIDSNQSKSNESVSYQSRDANEAAGEILESGVGVSWKQLRDPSSFRLRWSYWKVGFSMWIHNFFTGVGLGNFALAYPRYQYLGAGDVKECHNGYLQMLCETGVLGGVIFITFIISILYKIWTGLNRKPINLHHIALSIGILAFLLHAGLDIHFSHSSLITYFLITLSLFLFDEKQEGVENGNTVNKLLKSRGVFFLFFVLVMCLTYLSYPPYLRDLVRSRMSFLNVGKDAETSIVLKSINYTFTDVLQYALGNSKKQPKMSATVLKYFFVDLNNMRKYGNVYVPQGKGSNKATLLPEGEPVPDNAVLVIKNTWNFINHIRNASISYAKYLSRVDSIFPYQEDIPSSITEIYKQVFTYSPKDIFPTIFEESRKNMLFWGEETLKRSPQHGDLYYNFGKVLWLAGTKDFETQEEQIEFLKQAIYNFEKSASIWRIVPFYWDEYISHMKDARDIFAKYSLNNEVTLLDEKVEKATEYVTDLKEKRRKLNIW